MKAGMSKDDRKEYRVQILLISCFYGLQTHFHKNPTNSSENKLVSQSIKTLLDPFKPLGRLDPDCMIPGWIQTGLRKRPKPAFGRHVSE